MSRHIRAEGALERITQDRACHVVAGNDHEAGAVFHVIHIEGGSLTCPKLALVLAGIDQLQILCATQSGTTAHESGGRLCRLVRIDRLARHRESEQRRC